MFTKVYSNQDTNCNSHNLSHLHLDVFYCQEEEDAAKVYEEFVESFEDTGKSINRAWVKGGVVNPADRGIYLTYFMQRITFYVFVT